MSRKLPTPKAAELAAGVSDPEFDPAHIEEAVRHFIVAGHKEEHARAFVMRAAGATHSAICETFGHAPNWFVRIQQHHKHEIEMTRIALQQQAQLKLSESFEDVFQGLIDSAKDPENKNQPGSSREIREWIGHMNHPPRGGPLVQIDTIGGDVNNIQVRVDPKGLAALSDEELEERREEARRRIIEAREVG